MSNIKTWEREYLRDLAKKQLEIANGDEMKRKEKLWYDHNDYKTYEPVVTVERWTFGKEFEHLFKYKCESQEAQDIEQWFQSNMIQYEYIGDDTVMPREYPVGIGAWVVPFGINIKREQSISETHAYKIDYEICDLQEDFHKLQKSPSPMRGCNFESVSIYQARVEDILGDLMPARLAFSPNCCLAQNIFNLMGLETMMTSMYDYPELFHKMMQAMTDDYLALWDFVETNGYIRPNNFNVKVAQGTYGFTDMLPVNANAGNTKTGGFRTYEGLRSNLRRFLKKHNLEDEGITLYTFRHTFATILLEQRENPKIVAELMGHKKVDTTLNLYSHVLSKTVYQQTAQTLNGVYEKFTQKS